jgi:nucleoid-associated protein YgaU
MNTAGDRLLRGTLVWLAATAVAAFAAAAVRADVAALADGPGADLETALTRVGSLAVLACLTWGWLATTAVVVEALRGRPGATLGLPAPARRLLLAACGVALAGGLAGGPAAADPGLDGLPLPDRASGATAGPADRAPTAGAARVLVVRPGDSLWALAAADLGPGASPAAIDDRWRLLYALNRPAVGPDPDLILPGQQLRLPTPTEEPS